MWKEFKPTILFLLRFFGVYLLFSVLYGFYISSYDTADPPVTDPATYFISRQCARSASWLGYEVDIVKNDHLNAEVKSEVTYDSLWMNDTYALSVEEGCNGINIMILFIAFVVAFGGKFRNMLVFIPLGLIFIHIANIGRLLLLSLFNVEWEGYGFHFFHKYGFTASIYLAVLLLWYLWVMRFSGRKLFSKTKK